jgi:GntR family transcriptional regulator
MASGEPMIWRIDPGGELPIYRQLMRLVTEAVASGRLRPGDRLPSHRELAQLLVIAPLTVKKAYDALELSGMISSQHGRGTFVGEHAVAEAPGERLERLREPARHLAHLASIAGVSTAELVRIVRDAATELDHERRRLEGAR